MAVTKIKPIRGTVTKALAYILDPQKTDDAFYVSSYGCAASDAAAKEFEWTRNLAVQQGMQMPKVLARHLIQSFDIGEVTPEEAHEVGKQLADEWLSPPGGKRILRLTIPVLKYRTNSSSDMGWTTRRNTATCPISGCSNQKYIQNNATSIVKSFKIGVNIWCRENQKELSCTWRCLDCSSCCCLP